MTMLVDAAVTPDDEVRPWVMNEFRRFYGSVLMGVFGGAAFDQVALPAVAAAVDRTGRFAENFADRGVRSTLSSAVLMWGDDADRAAEAEWLKLRHRDVKGRGQGEFADVRYSALEPDAWLFVAVSAIFVFLKAFAPSTGTEMRRAEMEAAYDFARLRVQVLELPGTSGQFPATLADAEKFYDEIVSTKLKSNAFLVEQFAGLTRMPFPTLGVSRPQRVVLTPAWLVIRPLIGRIVQVCSVKTMHPGVRELTGFELRKRHDVEFAVYTRMLQLAWRLLPDSILLQPLARNRMQYEKLVRVYRRVGLESFAPPEGRGGCPF